MFHAFSLVTLTIIGAAVQERKYIHASCVNIGISSLHIDDFISVVYQDKIVFFYPLCRLLFLDFKKSNEGIKLAGVPQVCVPTEHSASSMGSSADAV